MRYFEDMVLCALALAFAAPSGDDPRIVFVGLAEPAILTVEVRSGRVVNPPSFPSAPSPLTEASRTVVENGKTIGFRIGPKGDRIQPPEKVVGKAWDAGRAEQLLVRIDGRPVRPVEIGRKSFPHDLAKTEHWKFEPAMTHRLYLRLPAPVREGARIEIDGPDLPRWSGRFDSKTFRTEGLRVQQIGFRPDDPSKTALYSLWMGTLGPSKPDAVPFEVVEAKGGKVVLKGDGRLHNPGDQPETITEEINAIAPVWVLDFTAVKEPGEYRLRVPGLGVSYPFRIGDDVYRNAFAVAAKGFYFQRNGIAHTRKVGPYEAPRAFHPDDGQVVIESTTSLMDSGNGLNALGTDKDNFGNLVKGATDRRVANAWGGYKDAGDWDSRIQHLDATRQLLELAELFPEVLATKLNLPESGKGMPDLLAECLWNIDHYKRMQTPEGGIRGGVEFEEHPRAGETSWTNHMRLFAYAPDPWSSWLYAATAARFAWVVRESHPAMAKEYRDSAVRAFDWAVAELARLNRDKLPHQVRDARCLAALELLRLTGDKRFEEAFRAAAGFLGEKRDLEVWQEIAQGEAAFLVLRSGLPADAVPAAREAVLRQADEVVKRTQETSFRFGHLNRFAYPGWSGEVSPRGIPYLAYAHRATGDPKYLTALLHANGFLSGINPSGIVYVSGVGANPIVNPFMIDPRMTNQPFPPGITVYGPHAAKLEGDGVWYKVVSPFLVPDLLKWPAKESFFDAYWIIAHNEFTVHQSMGPTAFAWGYLAFRK